MGIDSRSVHAVNPLFAAPPGHGVPKSHSAASLAAMPKLFNKFSFGGLFVKTHHSHRSLLDPSSRPQLADDETDGRRRRGLFSLKSAREGRGSLLSLVSGIDSRRSSANEHARARQEQQQAERTRKQQEEEQQTSLSEELKKELVARQNEYVGKIATMVEKLIEQSEAEVPTSPHHCSTGSLESTCSGKRIPKIGVSAYLQRLVKYVNVWMDEDQAPESSGVRTLLVALIYVDRALSADPTFVLSNSTMHRVFMGAMLVAIKFFEDEPISNRFWAQVGGVNLTDVNAIEAKICTTLQFNLNVPEALLEAYASSAN
jgi:hypothetical protein